MNTRSTHQCSACAVRNIWEHHRPAVGSNFWPLSERDRSLWEAWFVVYQDLLFFSTPKSLAKFQNILKKEDQDRNKSDPASRKMSLKFHQVWTEWKKSEQNFLHVYEAGDYWKEKISLVIGINQTNHSTNQERPCTTVRRITKELSVCQSQFRPDPARFPVLSQIKQHTPRLVVSFRQFL